MSRYSGAEAALRLARILDDASRTSMGARGEGPSAWSVVSKVLDVNRSSPSVSLRRVNRFRNLPVLIRKDVRRNTMPLPQVCSLSLANTELLFARSPLSEPWTSWQRELGLDASGNLRDISAILDPSGVAARRSVPRDSLLELRGQLVECLKEVEEVGPDSPIYDFLSDALESIIDAIDDYRVVGLSGLVAVVESVQADAPAKVVLSKAPPKLRRALILITFVAFLTHLVAQGVQDVEYMADQLPWMRHENVEVIEVREHSDSLILEVQHPEVSQTLTVKLPT